MNDQLVPLHAAHQSGVRQAPVSHILVVDDQALDAELTVSALACVAPHAAVKVLLDPAEALEYLRGEGRHADVKPAAPCLVLLDLHMPGRSSLDVLRELRADPRTRDLTVALCSSSDDPRDVWLGAYAGADRYVVKTASLDRFEWALRSTLEACA